MINTSKRRSYTPLMIGGQWRHISFYRFQMLRETTVGKVDWARFVAFLQHPPVLVLNVVLLLTAILHTVTQFHLAPKANIIIVGDHKLPTPIVTGPWVVTALFSLSLPAFSYFY